VETKKEQYDARDLEFVDVRQTGSYEDHCIAQQDGDCLWLKRVFSFQCELRT
jgi:hypothetical protein